MGKRYQNNMADQDLIVRSIKVLESIDGGGMKEIRQDIERVRQNTSIQIKQQEEYWKSLSDDGVITTIEKQSLKREMENIRQSFGAVTQQAASFGYTNPILQDYVNTYNALYEYIYETLALFDDMTTDTEISDRDTFNEYFSNYFFLENFILLAITKGVLDTLQFRVLESLNEPGTEGETALYHGGLYQYTDGRWKSVSTGNYKGAKSELPAAEEDSFFLASETFIMTDILIVNGTELLVNGEELMLSHPYIKGYIYYVEDGIWNVEEDKTNWRYAAAFADVLNVTGELPQIFQDGLDALQAQIDAVSGNLTDEINARDRQYTILNGAIVQIGKNTAEIVARINAELEDQQDQINGKISHLPQYFGGRNTLPENPQEGDWFTWTGGNLDPWYTGKVYKYTEGAWSGALDATNVANRSYFMLALEDILRTQAAGAGYFSTVFAESFFANSASLDNLAVKTIYIRGNGTLQSDTLYYTYQRAGLQIKSNGDIDANGDTHIAGKVAIGVDLKNEQGQYQPDFNSYNVVIGGNCLFKEGVLIRGAEIVTPAFECLDATPPEANVTYDANTKVVTELSGGVGTYNGKTFSVGYYVPASEGGYWIEVPVTKYDPNHYPNWYIDYEQRWVDTSTPEKYILNDSQGNTVEVITGAILQYQLSYTYSIASGSKVFKFKNLPYNKPAASGLLWIDSQGFLRIS